MQDSLPFVMYVKLLLRLFFTYRSLEGKWRKLKRKYYVTNYHWPICWMICVIQFVRLSFHTALRTDNPVHLISTEDERRVWPVNRGSLLLLGTWSYLRICQRSVLPYTRICNCLLDYDYVLHIFNFAILYIRNVKLIWYQFRCTRCAFRLLKSLQSYSGWKSWKCEKKNENCIRTPKPKYCAMELNHIGRRIELCMMEIILRFEKVFHYVHTELKNMWQF
jgi:hypothetical protein